MDSRHQPLSQRILEKEALPGIVEVRFFEETGSTNLIAMQWAARGAPEGSLVVADYQHSGRGRFDRKWLAARGECLLYSVVLRPAWSARYLGVINLAAATALCHCLARLGLDARVKWPNDVIIGGKKTAGILSEAASGKPQAVVVGIGLNVNCLEFPKDFPVPATSLALETGRMFDRGKLLTEFFQSFWPLYRMGPQAVIEAYVPICETLGADIRIETDGRDFEQRGASIDPQGNLVLADGEVLAAADVTHLRTVWPQGNKLGHSRQSEGSPRG